MTHKQLFRESIHELAIAPSGYGNQTCHRRQKLPLPKIIVNRQSDRYFREDAKPKTATKQQAKNNKKEGGGEVEESKEIARGGFRKLRKISSTRAKYITTSPRAKAHPLPILPILPIMTQTGYSVRVCICPHYSVSRCGDGLCAVSMRRRFSGKL